MRLVINLILILIVAALVYLLIYGIKEPIAFGDAKKARLEQVTNRLKQVRAAQEYYRDITGKFANSFDSLKYVLTNDSFTVVKIIGDPDDPNKPFERIETKFAALDSLQRIDNPFNLDSLRFVPNGAGELFEIQADTLTYQKTLVNVCEVRTRYRTFMGKYGHIRYARYDNTYDPDKFVKFGDMSAPNLGGNWE